MAKFCSNCGKELDEDAALCLNCGVLVSNTTNIVDKSKKNKGLPTWVIILIVVCLFMVLPIILIIGIVVTSFMVVGDTDFNLEEYIKESIVQKGTIGDTLRTDDFNITLTDAVMYNSIGEDGYKDIPTDGKEYLVFFFIVENISNESQYISVYDFNGYVDGYTTSVKYLFNDIDGTEKLGANLSPGKKTKGYVAFEVDTTWKECEIHFNDSFDDEQLVFAVVNEHNDGSYAA